MKRLFIVLVVFALVLGGGYLALRAYLHSSSVTGQVAQKIEAIYGGQVKVAAVDVGVTGSDVTGFELFEDSDQGNGPAWLKIGTLETDISLWDALAGSATPHAVTVRDAVLVLRFDRDGKLLTRFPGGAKESPKTDEAFELPAVSLKGGQIVFAKEGQTPLVVKNVQATMAEKDGIATLVGTADSDELGPLVLNGSFDTKAKKAEGRVATTRIAHVTKAMLDRVPFVPPAVWDEVRIAKADSTAELTASYDLAQGELHYRINLAPTGATVRVAAIDTTAEDARGKVVVADGVVRLDDVIGHAFGGTIETTGVADFASTPWKLDFPTIIAKGLDADELPPSWKVPKNYHGRLTGTAQIIVTSKADVGLHVQGHGEGEIRDAYFIVGKEKIENNGPVPIKWRPGGFDIPLKQTSRGPQFFAPGAALALAQVPAAEPEFGRWIGRGINTFLEIVEGSAQQIAIGGGAIARNVPAKFAPPAPAKPGEPPSYVDLNLKLKDVQLGKFAAGLGLKLPFPVDGKMTVQVKASLPINKAGDLTFYKIHGSAKVIDFRLADLELATLDADIVFDKGVLELRNARGTFAAPAKEAVAGTIAGNARLQIAPGLGELKADVTLERVPLAEFNAFLGQSSALGGTVSGKINARAVGALIKSPAAWAVDGALTSDRVTAFGLALDRVSAPLKLAGGVLTLTDVQAALEGAPVRAAASLTLRGNYPFQADLDLKGWNLATLSHLVPAWRPPVAVAGNFSASADLKGTLKPFDFKASGNASTDQLKVGTFLVQHGQLKWAVNERQATLSNVRFDLYGGSIAGTASVPLQPKAEGSLDFSFDKLEAKELAKALPIPFQLDGALGGTLKGAIPPMAEGQDRQVKIVLNLTAPKLRVQSIQAEALHGTLDYQKGVLDYKLEAKTPSVGGSVELDGQIPLKPADPKQPAKMGRLQVHNLSLDRLARAFDLKTVAPLQGLVNLDFHFTHDPETLLPKGRGQVRFSNVRWGQQAITSNLVGDFTAADGTMRLLGLNGSIGGGTIQSKARYNLRHPEQGFFVLNLDNVEASQLLGPWFDEEITGPLNARIVGRFGAELRGRADLEMTRGKVFGLEVAGWRMPVSWRYAPAQQRGQIDIYETTALVARGRASGRLSLGWDYAANVSGQLRFFGVDIAQVMRGGASASTFGGPLTGRFDFGGSGVRSVNDLTGTLSGSFAQTQAGQIPVLGQVVPFLRIGPSTTFQRGDVQANLDRGVLRLRRLSLEGGNYTLYADGTITLTGRLNLETIAHINNVGLPTARLQLLGLRIPLYGVLPVTIVTEVSNLLSNRVLYLRVTGTVHNPVIRPEPLPLITQEAARYFLGRVAGVPAGAIPVR